MRSSADKGALVTGHRPVSCFSSYRASSSAKRRRRGARAAEKAKGCGKTSGRECPRRNPRRGAKIDRSASIARGRRGGAVGGSAYLECLGHERLLEQVARGGDHGLRGGRPRDGAKHGAFLPRATDTDGPAKRSPRGARERCGSGRGRAHGTCVRSRSPVASAAERSDGVRASRSGRERGGASPRREIKNRPRSAKRFHPNHERTLTRRGFRQFNSALGHPG
jgi:hypothetical protein